MQNALKGVTEKLGRNPVFISSLVHWRCQATGRDTTFILSTIRATILEQLPTQKNSSYSSPPLFSKSDGFLTVNNPCWSKYLLFVFISLYLVFRHTTEGHHRVPSTLSALFVFSVSGFTQPRYRFPFLKENGSNPKILDQMVIKLLWEMLRTQKIRWKIIEELEGLRAK